MSLARTLAVTLAGLEGHLVDVEAHASPGLPGFTLVGLPDAAVRESRERVRAALTTCGVTWGEQRLTVNLSPADVRKSGTGFDLALALSVLGARSLLPARALTALERTVHIGELGLDGSVHPVRGILPAVRAAVEAGAPDVVVAAPAAREAALVPGARVRAVGHVGELVEDYGGRLPRRAPARTASSLARPRTAVPRSGRPTWPTSSARSRPATPSRSRPRAATTSFSWARPAPARPCSPSASLPSCRRWTLRTP